jgi:phosphoribosylanthranilate isomerase
VNALAVRPLLKVCGATTVEDVDLLAAAGADWAGLWYGIPGGPADLSLEAAGALAGHARERGVEPVLVTFLGDPEALREALDRTGVTHLQLHAYQPPAAVRALRGAVPGGLTVIKVLHVRAGECLERRFIGSYERAGTAVFLLDRATADGRVGSTGQPLTVAEVAGVLPAVDLPVMLAGGLTADPGEHRPLVADPRFAGIDVDTAAREPGGGFDTGRISAIARGWGTARSER